MIQLAWRQYQRRKLLARALRQQRILHDWTPSVLAARQRALVQKVYGTPHCTQLCVCTTCTLRVKEPIGCNQPLDLDRSA